MAPVTDSASCRSQPVAVAVQGARATSARTARLRWRRSRRSAGVVAGNSPFAILRTWSPCVGASRCVPAVRLSGRISDKRRTPDKRRSRFSSRNRDLTVGTPLAACLPHAGFASIAALSLSSRKRREKIPRSCRVRCGTRRSARGAYPRSCIASSCAVSADDVARASPMRCASSISRRTSWRRRCAGTRRRRSMRGARRGIRGSSRCRRGAGRPCSRSRRWRGSVWRRWCSCRRACC